MRSILALMRAAFLSAASYRLAMFFSVLSLIATVVPLYFISGALQPLVQESIQAEGGRYFGFLLVGIGGISLMTSAVGAVPGALGGSLGSGTLEALLVTRTSLPVLLLGMAAYPLSQSLLRALLLLAGGAVLGVAVSWSALPFAIVVAALLIITYLAIGLFSASLVLIFRTSGPLMTAVIAVSSLLGGVYYSTKVIPAWLQDLSALVPLTYALRPLRQLLLGGAAIRDVLPDVAMLTLFAITLLAAGSLAFGAALRYARRSGTLSQY